MMYRNFREYSQPLNNPELEGLRSWLRGETGTESLKTWLSAMYA